ncbi:MAG: hypothetical protein AAGM16_03235 [Pseudomonadota bacterium]
MNSNDAVTPETAYLRLKSLAPKLEAAGIPADEVAQLFLSVALDIVLFISSKDNVVEWLQEIASEIETDKYAFGAGTA